MIKLSLTKQLNDREQKEAMSFIKSEARKGRNEIGFIPWQGIERASRLGRVATLYRDGDVVGFLVFGPGSTSAKVFQIWVRQDARILEHGRAMLEGLEQWALDRGLFRISLWCAEDLAANLFWRALAFELTTTRVGGKSSGRHHNRWVLPLPSFRPSLPEASFSRTERLALRTVQTTPRDSGEACQQAQQRQKVLFQP